MYDMWISQIGLCYYYYYYYYYYRHHHHHQFDILLTMHFNIFILILTNLMH